MTPTTTTQTSTPATIVDLLAEWDAIATAPAGPVGWEAWQQRRIAADLWARSALAALADTSKAVE